MRTTDEPDVATFTGDWSGVRLAEQTNPWVEVEGKPVNWTEYQGPRVECPCEEQGLVVLPGVLDSMDSDDGVQRCDTCNKFEGDLDAALALARLVGGVVRYERG